MKVSNDIRMEILTEKVNQLVEAICACKSSLDEPEGKTELARRIRAIFPTYSDFRETFYKLPRYSSEPLNLIKPVFDEDDIIFIATANEILQKREGLKDGEGVTLEAAKDVVETYIKDSRIDSLSSFCGAEKISRIKFTECLRKVEEGEPELYALYRNATKSRLQERLADPIRNIDKIINGIVTGMNENDEKFTVLDFYRLAPWRGNVVGDRKDLEVSLRNMISNYPDDCLELQKAKQEYRETKTAEMQARIEEAKAKLVAEGKESEANKMAMAKSYPLNYGELLFLFTAWILGKDAGNIMLKYIKENDIKSFYPVYEAAEKAKCIKTSVD